MLSSSNIPAQHTRKKTSQGCVSYGGCSRICMVKELIGVNQDVAAAAAASCPAAAVALKLRHDSDFRRHVTKLRTMFFTMPCIIRCCRGEGRQLPCKPNLCTGLLLLQLLKQYQKLLGCFDQSSTSPSAKLLSVSVESGPSARILRVRGLSGLPVTIATTAEC